VSITAAIRRKIVKEFDRASARAVKDVRSTLEDEKLLIGRMASWQVRSMQTLSSLKNAEFRVSSQWGQDGIIDWLVERANIPYESQSFIEFGVEDYSEANTRFLLQNRNWRGLILDGSSAMVEALKRYSLAWKHDIKAVPSFITRENINGLISDAGFIGDVGLMSVDVDGNDYWIWEAIDVVRPILCVCEYNAVFGDVYPITVPYDPAFMRTEKHFSNLYFGASIGALRFLAAKKGYRFAGTTSAGNDAFFVREDYAGRFLDRSIRSFESNPSRARESRDVFGKLNYIGGVDRLQQIVELPVVNVETGVTAKLGDLGPVYSADWGSPAAA